MESTSENTGFEDHITPDGLPRPNAEPRPLQLGEPVVLIPGEDWPRLPVYAEVVELHDDHMVVRSRMTGTILTVFYEDINWPATNHPGRWVGFRVSAETAAGEPLIGTVKRVSTSPGHPQFLIDGIDARFGLELAWVDAVEPVRHHEGSHR